MYDKAALTCQIACANSINEPTDLRENLLFFHMCVINSRQSTDPVVFIQDLIGMFCQKVKGFCNLLKRDQDAYSYATNTHLCSSELHDCFKSAVITILNRVDEDQTNSIIMIDSIDVCSDSVYDGDSIYTLLQNHIIDFPRFIKFFITSRPLPFIKIDLETVNLISKEAEDFEDAMEDSDEIVRLAENNTVIESLLESGNMEINHRVLAKHGLFHTFSSYFAEERNMFGSFSRTGLLVPDRILVQRQDRKKMPPFGPELIWSYTKDLRRLFNGKKDLLYCAKRIFAIIKTSLFSCLSPELLIKIAMDGYRCDYETLNGLIMNQVSHFIRISTEKSECAYETCRHVHFQDQYIAHWLFDPMQMSSDFHVREELGHNLIAKFYLRHSDIIHDKYIIDKLKSINEGMDIGVFGCGGVNDTLPCIQRFCFHKLLYHVVYSDSRETERHFKNSIIHPLMGHSRTHEMLHHVARHSYSEKPVRWLIQIIWPLNPKLLEQAACHSVSASNSFALQAILPEDVDIENIFQEVLFVDFKERFINTRELNCRKAEYNVYSSSVIEIAIAKSRLKTLKELMRHIQRSQNLSSLVKS